MRLSFPVINGMKHNPGMQEENKHMNGGMKERGAWSKPWLTEGEGAWNVR